MEKNKYYTVTLKDGRVYKELDVESFDRMVVEDLDLSKKTANRLRKTCKGGSKISEIVETERWVIRLKNDNMKWEDFREMYPDMKQSTLKTRYCCIKRYFGGEVPSDWMTKLEEDEGLVDYYKGISENERSKFKGAIRAYKPELLDRMG